MKQRPKFTSIYIMLLITLIMLIGTINISYAKLEVNHSLSQSPMMMASTPTPTSWVLDYDFRDNQYGWDWSLSQSSIASYLLGEGFSIRVGNNGTNAVLSNMFLDLSSQPININHITVEYSFDGATFKSLQVGISSSGGLTGNNKLSTLPISQGSSLITSASPTISGERGNDLNRFKLRWSTTNNDGNAGATLIIHRIRFEGIGEAPISPNQPVTPNWSLDYDFRVDTHGWAWTMSQGSTTSYQPGIGFQVVNKKTGTNSVLSYIFSELNDQPLNILNIEIEYSLSGYNSGTSRSLRAGTGSRGSNSGGINHLLQFPAIGNATSASLSTVGNINNILSNNEQLKSINRFKLVWSILTGSSGATLTIHRIRFAGSGEPPTTASCLSGGIGLMSNSCEIPTPTPVPDSCKSSRENIIYMLSTEYSFFIIDSLTLWSDDEIKDICNGIVIIGQALQTFALTQNVIYTSPSHAFTSIMLFDPTDTITLQIGIPTNVGPHNCATAKAEILSNLMAVINCGDLKHLDQYTIVHELGHVFVHRTTQIMNPNDIQAHPCYSPSTTSQSLNGCIVRPVPNAPNESLGFGNTEFVMGVRSLYLTHTEINNILNQFSINENELTADDFYYQAWFAPSDMTEYHLTSPDWLRGERGWGSTAPIIGPCDKAPSSAFLPTSFQQNPCIFYKWLHIALGTNEEDLILARLGTIENEEAMADMFLNWVYRTQGVGGFNNIDGQGISDNISMSNLESFMPNSFSPPRQGPGDDRFYWMNYVMSQIFAYYEF